MINLYKLLNNFMCLTLIPGILIIAWVSGLILTATLIVCLIAVFFVFVILPIVFRYSINVQRGLLFLTFVKYPYNFNLTHPTKSGLYGTRNLYVTYNDPLEKNATVQIGTWHMLPNNLVKRFSRYLNINQDVIKNISKTDDDQYSFNELTSEDVKIVEESLQELGREPTQVEIYETIIRYIPSVIILYLHGNSGSRATDHRLQLYKIFRSLNYHIFTIDYRGYADSSKIPPTELGVIEDALQAYQYIVNITTSPVFIYGHSLGTGVGCHLLKELHRRNLTQPKGIFLEAPFNNLRDEVAEHKLAQIFKITPWYEATILDAMESNNFLFKCDEHIGVFHQPICMMHAEDDFVVPFKLGYKLYRKGLDIRPKSWGPIEFHRFDSSMKYGHLNIYKHPGIKSIISNFTKNYMYETY